MPELPEAETIARDLNRRLSGYTFGPVTLSRADIVHGDPRPLEVLLPGRCVRGVRRRAKRVMLDLDDGVLLVFRLGMTGQLTLVDAELPTAPHTHLRIAVPELGCELRFRDPRRFGGVWCLTGSEKTVGKPLGEVGPEPLDLTPGAFRQVLQRRRQMKALLMDQRVIAGLGNIYCDEALHAACIHPLTCANLLDAATADRLLRAIKRVLGKAIRFNGSTLSDYRRADGTAGSFQKHHRVYQRYGKPCRTCGTHIVRIQCAGRSTFLCPKCQRQRPAKSRRRSPKMNAEW